MYDLYKNDKRRVLEGVKRGVFKVFKDDLGWQTRSGAFKTVELQEDKTSQA